MVFRGVTETIRAANRAALLADGWTQGPRLRVTGDQLVNGAAQLAMMTAADEHHEPREAAMSTPSYDFGPRARLLAEADEQLAADRVVELANGGTGAAVSRAAEIMARHQAAGRRSRAAAMQAQPQPCGPTDDFGRCIEPHHSMDCSGLPANLVSEATFAAPGAEADAAWQRAAEQRQRMTTIARGTMRDECGRTFTDQHGRAYGLANLVDENAGHVSRRGYGPQHPELPVAQKRAVTHRDWDEIGEENAPETGMGARAVRESFDPVKESPAELASRRALRGGSPARGRHWGDAYDDAPNWDDIARA